MKKLLMTLLSLMLLNSAYAYDSAKLRMKIAGPIDNNRYFLCVTNVGCMSILAGNKGKVFPLNPGSVSNIVTVDMGNKRMQPQAMPKSCDISVKENQMMTVTAKLVKGANDKVVLSNLHCSIS